MLFDSVDRRIYICTPWYRKYPMIDTTIKSVLNQTYKNFKWTIIDNSNDFFLKDYFEKFFEENKELAIYKDKVNIIPLKAPYTINDKNLAGFYKNIAINLSGATDNDFIMMLDSDDFINEDTLEEIIKIIDNDPTVELVTGTNWIREDYNKETGEIKGSIFYTSGIIFAESKISGRWFQYPRHPICFKKGPFIAVTGGYNEVHGVADDVYVFRAAFKLRNAMLSKDCYHSVIYGSDVNYSGVGDFNKSDEVINSIVEEYKEFLKLKGIQEMPSVDY